MTLERFQDVLGLQPFQAFTIHLADGRNVHVASREFIAAAPTGRTVAIFQPNGKLDIIDLLLVTDLELDAPIPPTQKKRSRNGKH